MDAMEQSLRFDGPVTIDPNDNFFEKQLPVLGLEPFCP